MIVRPKSYLAPPKVQTFTDAAVLMHSRLTGAQASGRKKYNSQEGKKKKSMLDVCVVGVGLYREMSS